MWEEGRTARLLLHRLSETGERRALLRNSLSSECKPVLLMNSSSYLRLERHPRVIDAVRRAASKWGSGTGSVSMYGGVTELHRELERKLADFYHKEDCILFNSGYAANLGALSGLLREGDPVVGDVLNHLSIRDGCRLAGALLKNYRHCDSGSLARVLDSVEAQPPIVVVTDGVFSMEGDVAPLDLICEECVRRRGVLIVDEAHSLGVVGPQGRGTGAHFGVEEKIDLITGTLSKAVGGIGGYVVGSAEVVDYLRYFARPYVFSASLPPTVVAGAIEAIDVIASEPWLHQLLWTNIRRLKQGLETAGFDTRHSDSAIISLFFNDEMQMERVFEELLEQGVLVNYVIFPAVSRKRPRLRVSVTAEHSFQEIDRVVEILDSLRARYHLNSVGSG